MKFRSKLRFPAAIFSALILASSAVGLFSAAPAAYADTAELPQTIALGTVTDQWTSAVAPPPQLLNSIRA